MRKFLNKIISYIYPNRCISCGKLFDKVDFCDACRKSCRPLDTARCAGCNQYIYNCNCASKNGYKGLVSAYLYADTTRAAILKFKFRARPEIAEPFGKTMAELIHLRYPNVDFDGIVFVPMTRKGLHKRGYNQAELLANIISRELMVPVFSSGLAKTRESEKQHTLSAAARRRNVKGLYISFDDLKGKTLLLVDDIRTTGETLRACTKALKKAGAKEIYCAAIASAL